MVREKRRENRKELKKVKIIERRNKRREGKQKREVRIRTDE